MHSDLAAKIELQLSACRIFLGLAGNNLTGEDCTKAFNAAGPLVLFSVYRLILVRPVELQLRLFEDLLECLLRVVHDADNVNQCFLEAWCFGSTYLVHILFTVQIACGNSLEVDADLAFGFALHYVKIETMERRVKKGTALAFSGSLKRAVERVCLLAV